MKSESYDARLDISGWCEPRFDDSQWQSVKVFPPPGIDLVARTGPPVRRTQEILASVFGPAKGFGWGHKGLIYEMRQNMVGRVRLKVRGKRGITLTICHAAMLDGGGLYTANLRTALQPTITTHLCGF